MATEFVFAAQMDVLQFDAGNGAQDLLESEDGWLKCFTRRTVGIHLSPTQQYHVGAVGRRRILQLFAARLKEQERLKERRELEQQERLDQLLKKANEVDQRRKQNEAELEKLKKQQVAEKKKMVTLEKKRKAEEKRVAALEKKRKQQAAQEKKRRDEKRRKVAERKRKEKQVADRKRKQEQQRQRELQEQLAREQVQRRARNALERYVPIIQQHVERNWNRPPNIPPGMRAKVRVRLSPGGEVRDVRVVVSSGDPVFDRSVEYAVYKSTPLPLPDDPSVAEYLRREQILFTFSPSEV